MNARTTKPAPEAPDNLKLWDALGKTDPKHTKSFSRAGGFKGTALKPIWIVKRLTELFGPVGEGWGMGEPTFTTATTNDGEMLVYCTVKCWHTDPHNAFFGVGGDKVVAKRSSGFFADDEAFKKAFTDAVGNAFKFLGVGADIHMGQFDDSKYVAAMTREFGEAANANAAARGGDQGHSQKEGTVSPDAPKPREKLGGPHTSRSALQTAVRGFVHEMNGCGDADELSAFLHTKDNLALLEQIQRDMPQWWNGGPDMPEEFVPLYRQIEIKEYEMAQQVAALVHAG